MGMTETGADARKGMEAGRFGDIVSINYIINRGGEQYQLSPFEGPGPRRGKGRQGKRKGSLGSRLAPLWLSDKFTGYSLFISRRHDKICEIQAYFWRLRHRFGVILLKKTVRIIGLVIADGVLVNLSYMLAFLLRFEFNTDSPVFLSYFEDYLSVWIFLTLIKILIFFFTGLYNSLWRYAGTDELGKVVIAGAVATAAATTFLMLVQSPFPRSVTVITMFSDILFIGGLRFGYRYVRGLRGNRLTFSAQRSAKRVMIVGAGDAGAAIIKEMKLHPGIQAVPVIAIDDNKSKLGSRISGVRIVGTRKDITKMARRYKINEIFISIPTANKKEIQDIMTECGKTNCKVKILPAIYELIGGQVSISRLRDVDIEDLLGREPVEVDLKEITSYLKGKIVMVTGAGGSIGSELCRQIAKYMPRKIVALDIYENGVFDVQNEMKMKHPEVELQVVICSVADPDRMKEVFEKYRPHVVFHAAAHKHVPLMESNPKEAVQNNVFGTQTVTELSEQYAVEKFVMISTDKAVNPCNVMGATKRASEMIVQARSKRSRTLFSAVRFGNVLGSNGSVVPIFRRQIAEGGPVTVTHPDVTRYFMTISEAVQLVIQAGAMANGGEIFILDMGKPVRIMELAENLIKLSGFKPYDEIPIKIIGLRPGEKLYEELLLDEEGIDSTSHKKIYVGKPLDLSMAEIRDSLEVLQESLKEEDKVVKRALRYMVPTYHIKEEPPKIFGNDPFLRNDYV